MMALLCYVRPLTCQAEENHESWIFIQRLEGLPTASPSYCAGLVRGALHIIQFVHRAFEDGIRVERYNIEEW